VMSSTRSRRPTRPQQRPVNDAHCDEAAFRGERPHIPVQGPATNEIQDHVDAGTVGFFANARNEVLAPMVDANVGPS